MNSFGYGILGGIAGGAEGLIEQRRQEAEEAKAMNLARFQQQLSQQNYEFQGEQDEQRDIAAEGRAATREDEVRAVAGADEAGVAVFADKKGNLYRNGQPYTGPVYEKGLKRERDAMDFSKTFTDENGQIVAYDPKNPGAQYVVGKDGNYKPKGELSEAAQLAANARLSELNEMGVTDANVGEVNAIRKKLGLPTLKKTETKPAKDGWFSDTPAEYEFKEDWQGEEPSGKPEVLPKMGAAGGRDIHSAIVQVESNGDQSAVSNKGATGAMQLMPATAKSLGVNPKDKLQNAAGGVKLFDDLLAKYKNEDVALAAYNWGEPKVDKWLERGAKFEELPAETQGYIKKVRALTGGSAPASAPTATGEAQAATVPPREAAAPTKPEIIPKQAAAAPGKMPQEWVNGVLSRADKERAASKQQGGQVEGPLASSSPSPVGGFEAAASAGMAQDEETKGGESFGATVGKAVRGVQSGAEAVGKGALYLRDQGEKVGKLDWWQEQLAKLKEWQVESLAAAKARAGINDQVLQEMYAQEAEKGKSFEQFIKDFIEGYSGKEKR